MATSISLGSHIAHLILQAISDWAKSRTLQEQRRFLPVYDCRDELLQVIRENQVVVVVGETGSGKTTQVQCLQVHVCIADIHCLFMVLQQYVLHVVQDMCAHLLSCNLQTYSCDAMFALLACCTTSGANHHFNR